jgi:hypothetical protein
VAQKADIGRRTEESRLSLFGVSDGCHTIHRVLGGILLLSLIFIQDGDILIRIDFMVALFHEMLGLLGFVSGSLFITFKTLVLSRHQQFQCVFNGAQTLVVVRWSLSRPGTARAGRRLLIHAFKPEFYAQTASWLLAIAT